MALSTQEKKPPVFGGKSPGGLQASKWKTGKGWTVNVSEYSLRAGGSGKAEGALGEGDGVQDSTPYQGPEPCFCHP